MFLILKTTDWKEENYIKSGIGVNLDSVYEICHCHNDESRLYLYDEWVEAE